MILVNANNPTYTVRYGGFNHVIKRDELEELVRNEQLFFKANKLVTEKDLARL